MRFDEKRVLVTGASRGIGRAVALQFAGAGARVAVHYQTNQSAAETTLAELPGTGHTLCAGDVADPDAVSQLVAKTVTDLGGLDILVNNAGIFEAHPVDENQCSRASGGVQLMSSCNSRTTAWRGVSPGSRCPPNSPQWPG